MSDQAHATICKDAEPLPSSAAKADRKYLFAILHADDVRPWGCNGLDGKEVSVIVEGRLAAVVALKDARRLGSLWPRRIAAS